MASEPINVSYTPTSSDLSATDYTRWSSRDRYHPGWHKRSIEAVALVSEAKWICDVGCGPFQGIRSIRPDAVYLPADLHAWTSDTEVCELNKLKLPLKSLGLCDVVFFLGVFEYIHDPAKVLAALAPHVERMVVSYNPTDTVPDGRAEVGWVNSLTRAEFLAAIEAANLKIEKWQMVEGENRAFIALVSNPGFGIQKKLKRRMRRLAFRAGLTK